MLTRPSRATFVALAMAAVSCAVSLGFGARAVGGADSYGYVSQADLWLGGNILQKQDGSAGVPLSRPALAPLGYRPEVDGFGIVPVYAPGLPLIMAACKLLAGHQAVFWVVPLFGGVLILATYAIGRRLEQPLAGVAAALLIATSPTVIFMAMSPMSDVPCAALWTVAFALALGGSRRSALVSGAAAAAAILVRPNLVPLAAIVVVWMLVRDLAADGWRRPGHWRFPWFAAASALGAIAIAAFNARFYGSSLSSGYGSFDGVFGLERVLTNLRLYTVWLIEAETPLALLSLLCLLAPLLPIWGTAHLKRARWLFAPVTLFVWIFYFLYFEYDAWWFLRFMLPTWPIIAIGTALIGTWVWSKNRRWARAVVALALASIAARGILFAQRHDAFEIGRTASLYPEVAHTVKALTDANSVFIAVDHSGSLRYYGGRVAVRWDRIDAAEIDPAIEWFIAHGHHPYLVLNEWEVTRLRARSGDESEIARLAWPPTLSFFGGRAFLYDVMKRHDTILTTSVGTYSRRAVPPVLDPLWIQRAGGAGR